MSTGTRKAQKGVVQTRRKTWDVVNRMVRQKAYTPSGEGTHLQHPVTAL